MIKTLAKIKGYAAKAAFSILIGNNGTITQKELIQAGFTASRAKEAMLQLQINDIVIKITAGVYRVKEEARPQAQGADRQATQNTEARPQSPEAHGQSPEARPQATEPILESASSRKYTPSPKARPQSQGARPQSPEAHRRADSTKPVNVVNVVNSTNQLSDKEKIEPRISSTDEIEKFIAEMPIEKRATFEKFMQIYGQALPVPGMSRDLLIRIAGAPFFIGVQIPLEMIHDWYKEAHRAEKNGNVNYEWQAIANSTKQFYQKFAVKWTKCRPNGVIAANEKLKSLKIQTPNGEMSALEFITFKQLDNQERYAKATKPSKKGGV